MKTLAATAIAIAVCLPFAAFAQTPPPPPPPVVPLLPQPAPQVAAAVPELKGTIDLSRYSGAQRTEIWSRYAKKNQLSVNILYPVGNIMISGMWAAFWQFLGDDRATAPFGIPVEYERSIHPNWSVLGVFQPTWLLSRIKKDFTLGLGAGARYYFTGNAPQGVWTGIQVDHTLGINAVTFRQELGFNTIFEPGLTLSVGAGFGVTYASGVYFPGSSEEVPIMPAMGLRISIGYAL